MLFPSVTSEDMPKFFLFAVGIMRGVVKSLVVSMITLCVIPGFKKKMGYILEVQMVPTPELTFQAYSWRKEVAFLSRL